MLQDVWRLGSAKVVLIHDGRIAQLTFSGLVTEETLGGLIRLASDVYGAKTRGWLSDFTKAAMLVGPAEMTPIAINSPPGSVLRLPGAFVVTPRLVPRFQRHALSAAAHGLRRRAFYDRPEAVRWLRSAVEGRYCP